MAVKVGDKIVITNAAGTRGKYKDGDVLTVAGFLGCNYVEVEEHDRIIDYKEFEVVSEQSATDVKLAELEGRIAALEAAQPSAQQAQTQAAEQPQALKEENTAIRVGDYAKVVEHDNDNYFGGKPGDIVKVVEVTASGYETQELNGGNFERNPFANKDALVPATDEEVEEAKRQSKAAAKLAEIGRKPGEFKAGDIVRVKDTLMTTFLTVDQIAEVVSYDADDRNPRVKSDDGGTRYAIVELVTPVERRFDRG